MTVDEIIMKHEELSKQLKVAASTMALSDDVKTIFAKIKDLQEQCPHFSAKHNFEIIDDKCPYCGKKLE